MNGIVAAVQGRVTRDPDFKYTSQGTPMLVLNLAANDDKRTDDGPTEWVRATLWQEQAEQLQDRLRKGSEVYVEGRVHLSTWTTMDGTPRAALRLNAWLVQPMGIAGAQRPARRAAPAAEPIDPAEAAPHQYDEEADRHEPD